MALPHPDLEEHHPTDYPACRTLIPRNFRILSIQLNYLFPIPSLLSLYLIVFITQPPHETIGGHQFRCQRQFRHLPDTIKFGLVRFSTIVHRMATSLGTLKISKNMFHLPHYMYYSSWYFLVFFHSF